ncbi:hypothetical protein T06_10514 [Trichinella sp. T6]|nr:hypothetical protein T06_10514 [Trichinella sp. T6]
MPRKNQSLQITANLSNVNNCVADIGSQGSCKKCNYQKIFLQLLIRIKHLHNCHYSENDQNIRTVELTSVGLREVDRLEFGRFIRLVIVGLEGKRSVSFRY